MYGLLPRGLDGKESYRTRVEDIAADYVQAVRTVQPEGPYHLVGYSFGGIVAFEVAQQITAQGGQIGLLGMFDTIEWHYLDKIDKSLQPGERFEVFREHLQTVVFSKNRIPYLTKLITAKFQNIKYRLFNALGRPLPQKVAALEEVNFYAGAGYSPRPYPGRLTLFRSTKRSIGEGDDEFLGWGAFAAGGIDVHHVPSTHFNILKEPGVKVVAEKLQSCLDREFVVSPECVDSRLK